MTSTTIRDAALSCEAKKHAYRQTQDGVVISFVLHPQEVPDGLATAPLGTRYALVVVEIGDDEQPVTQKGGGANPNDERSVSSTANKTPPASAPEQPARASRPFTSLPLPQQAALLCQDNVFLAFLNEEFSYNCNTADDAADAIRELCKVTSRADIKPDSIAARRFASVREQYLAWKIMAA